VAQYPLPQLVHRTRGRLRYRWRRLSDPALDPEYFEAWLENTEGVARARVNPRAACVVIELAPQGSGADFGNVLLRVPARAFSRGVPAPPRRGLGDAVFHAAMTAAVAAMPPGLQLPVAAAMGAPAVLKGAETLLTQGLKVRVLDMATIGFSLLRGDYVAAASISTMVVVGEFLRQATEDRSNGLLKSLVAAPVESVWVRRGDAEVAVAFADVVPGDLVLAGSGGLVAVDGLVVAGEALLDCSSITGESAPVYVKEGAEILSGCVVREGAVTIEAGVPVPKQTWPEFRALWKMRCVKFRPENAAATGLRTCLPPSRLVWAPSCMPPRMTPRALFLFLPSIMPVR
jgi:Cu2+-exporting ATPase